MHPLIIRTASLPSLTFLLLLSGAYAYAERSSRHVDPLKAISGRHDSNVPTTKRARTQNTSRHYSPLDALNGKITVRKRKSTTPAPSAASDPNKVIRLDVKPAAQSDTQERAADPATVSALDGMVLPPKNATLPQQKLPIVPAVTAPETRPKKVHIIVTEPDSERLTEAQLKALAKTPIKPLPKPKAYHMPKQKQLYLTFDDGPIGKGTVNLLRVLREENVQATLFYIGREVVHHPKLFQQALSMPNVLVANHTFTHANNHYRRFYNSAVSHVVADIDKAQNAIGGAKYLRLCGRNVWRLPAIKRNDWGISVAQRGREAIKYDALWNRGYFIYGWDTEWAFSHKTQRPLFSGEEMARRVNLVYAGHRTRKPGKVVLLAHDFMFQSAYNVQQLHTFIHIMKAQKWIFKTIDDYSSATPNVFVQKKETTDHNALRPAQKLAMQAKLRPIGHPTTTLKTKRTARLSSVSISEQLRHAIQKQSFLAIRRLLSKNKTLINKQDPQGDIPLNTAIRTNNAVLVRMLVERGARIFNMDAAGMSPMGIAREQKSTVIIRYLKHQIALQQQQRLHQTIFASNESITQQ